MTDLDAGSARRSDNRVADAVRDFYERHCYPAPIESLDSIRVPLPGELLAEHHLVWPRRDPATEQVVLIAGCGSSQAARHALRWPRVRFVGIDVSEASLGHTASLKDKHNLDNLELRQFPVERASELNRRFDQIVCTGVLHHLPDPDTGLRALRDVLAEGGALQIMLYAPYGRAGVYLLQDYCRRVGLGASVDDIRELAQVLRSLPHQHPLWPLLEKNPDFRYDAGLADALLHPRDRPYSVPEVMAFLASNGLRFGRWLRQAPYLPHCGAASQTPHYARLTKLPPEEQYAAMELFRGSMVRHSFIAYRGDEPRDTSEIRFDGEQWLDYRPIPSPGSVRVEEGLPPGVSAVLINRRHTETDIYLPVTGPEKAILAEIDGVRSIRELPAHGLSVSRRLAFYERLWRHDQIVFAAPAA